MRLPFVTRRRHDAEISSLRSQYEALRERCKGAESREAAERVAKRTAARQFTEADEERTALTLVNARLTDNLTAVREELAELRAQTSDSAATHWSAEARREKKRADRLQKQYDDAVGLKPGGIEDSRPWQPGYIEPKKATP